MCREIMDNNKNNNIKSTTTTKTNNNNNNNNNSNISLKIQEEEYQKSLSLNHRLVIVTFALLQNAISGGIIYGWASIDDTLLISSITLGGPNLTKLQTTQIFSLASGLNFIAPLPLGIILDTFGPRICSTISSLLVAIGCYLMSLNNDTNTNNFITFAIGTCLVACGGVGSGSSIIHVSNLFPINENLVMSCLSGSVSLSFSIFPLFTYLWQYQPNYFTYQFLFRSYSIIMLFFVFGSYYLYPNQPFEQQQLEQQEQQQQQQQIDPNNNKNNNGDMLDMIEKSEKEKLGIMVDTTTTTTTTSEIYSLTTDSESALLTPISKSEETRSLIVVESLPEQQQQQQQQQQQYHHRPKFIPPPIAADDDDDVEEGNDEVEDWHQHHHRLIEQPLNSTLREPSKLLHKTKSYLRSEYVINSGNRNAMKYISLKDQPFYKQLCSWSYIRAVLIFVITSFYADFYIASMSTELADRQYFSSIVQHELAQIFTILMSLGIFAGIVAGYIIDRIGLEACTGITLLFGQFQMLCLINWFDNGSSNSTSNSNSNNNNNNIHSIFMIIGFCFYTCFRAFLFPVYIGSLTARLGFKYFGMLLGIGFAISGITKLLQANLVQLVQGNCHLVEEDEEEELCNHGIWTKLHIIQIIILCLLMVVPILDRHTRLRRERSIQKFQERGIEGPSSPSSSSSSSSSASFLKDYGTITVKP